MWHYVSVFCIGALRYSVGRRGWRCIRSQKVHKNTITVADYVSFLWLGSVILDGCTN